MGHGCVASLYKHIANGELRAIKVGKRTLVLEEDRQKFLASRPEAKIAPPTSGFWSGPRPLSNEKCLR
jgi:hypothetical protein